jgi:hypothetical protein
MARRPAASPMTTRTPARSRLLRHPVPVAAMTAWMMIFRFKLDCYKSVEAIPGVAVFNKIRIIVYRLGNLPFLNHQKRSHEMPGLKI